MGRHTPNSPSVPVLELLNQPRELSASERSSLARLSDLSWSAARALLQARAGATYAVATPADFAACVGEHLSREDASRMRDADRYECPTCHRILKDRTHPIASVILDERERLRELWLDVEQSPVERLDEALDRFRNALGLPT